MRIVQIGLDINEHAKVLSHLGVLVAVCDLDPQRSKECGQTYSVNHYTTSDELLDVEEFDAALVVMSASTNAGIVKKMLEAGKHVFVDGPITYKSEDSQMLAGLAERNKVILACSSERFNPAASKVKEMIDSKQYGEMVTLESHRELRMPPHSKDVGIIYDASFHDIDTANWLFGEMPQMVFARAGKARQECEDFASIMLGYSNGKVAVISTNWITPKRTRRLSIVCTDATVSSDLISQETIVTKEKESETAHSEMQDTLRLEVQGFLDAVGGKASDIVGAREAANITKIAEAALLSSQKGIPIYLDLK